MNPYQSAGLFGSSPLTRGALMSQELNSGEGGLIPAYAGSTKPAWGLRGGRRAHPRLRGEHELRADAEKYREGSSPLTRGAPMSPRRIRVRIGLIPAYAGSTRAKRAVSNPAGAHPRLRGEHSETSAEVTPSSGSSPLTRGAQQHERHPGPPLGLIPAYAGSTISQGSESSSAGAHPRLRGEHWQAKQRRLPCLGSSPLTRGALLGARVQVNVKRLIPAYAGSTALRRP